jgi:transposase-like protein
LRDTYDPELHEIRELQRTQAFDVRLEKVYGVVSEDSALFALEEFKEKWGSKYPQISKMWEINWAEISTFFKYPQEKLLTNMTPFSLSPQKVILLTMLSLRVSSNFSSLKNLTENLSPI